MSNLDNKSNKNLLSLALILGSIGISKLFKFNFILGSIKCFSAVSVMGPLSVVFGGLFGGLFFLVINLIFNTGSLLLAASTGIPSLFAGWYWSSSSKLFKIGIPLFCMALFWENPVGLAAWPYALFWLVPSLIAAFNTNNIFLKSLGATFMAHAVGSIIWLYAVPMTASSWLSLLPIVPVERLLFAVSMACVYGLVTRFAGKMVSSSFGVAKKMLRKNTGM